MTTPSADPAVTHEPIRITSKAAPVDSEMVTLFFLDDVEYKIPKRPRANLALKQLQLVRELGPDMANVALLRELMGAQAFDTLAALDSLSEDDLKSVSAAAMRLTMGALEEGSDESASGN